MWGTLVMFPVPRRATQTHLPHRPRKIAWDGVVVDLILPYYGAPLIRYIQCNTSLVDTANHDAPKRHATLTRACVSFPNGTEPGKHTFCRGREKLRGRVTISPHGAPLD